MDGWEDWSMPLAGQFARIADQDELIFNLGTAGAARWYACAAALTAGSITG
jgi:hypothetical protein